MTERSDNTGWADTPRHAPDPRGGPAGTWTLVAAAEGVLIAAGGLLVAVSRTRIAGALPFGMYFPSADTGATPAFNRMSELPLIPLQGSEMFFRRLNPDAASDYEFGIANAWENPATVTVPIVVDYVLYEVVP